MRLTNKDLKIMERLAKAQVQRKADKTGGVDGRLGKMGGVSVMDPVKIM